MKTLYRSSTDSYIGGVCGGIGQYTNVDPIIWRAAFLFIPGTLWVYLFLWLLVKQEK